MKKDGVAENSMRGVWSLTERGSSLSEKEIEKIRAAVVAADAERRKAQKLDANGKPNDTEVAPANGGSGEVGVALSTSDVVSVTFDQELLGVLRQMAADAFERLCQRVLRESGFTKVEVTGRTNDGGIDGIGILRVNLVSFHVVFQCKKYSGSVGPGVIRDFRGGMVGRADKGLVITTGTFTSEARKEAIRAGAPAIDLVDGDTLCALLKDLGLGVKAVTVYEVDKSFFMSQ